MLNVSLMGGRRRHVFAMRGALGATSDGSAGSEWSLPLVGLISMLAAGGLAYAVFRK